MSENKSSLTRQLKELISEFVDPSTKEIHEKPTGRYYGRKQLDDRRIRILRMTCDFLINTCFLKPETVLYINDRYITYAGVAEIMQREGKDTNANSVQSAVYWDTLRFSRRMTQDFFVNLVEYNSNIDDLERRVVNALIGATGTEDLFRNLALRIPESTVVRLGVSEEDFFDFFKTIAPYSPTQMAYIQECLPVDVLNYCKYLVSSTLLTEQERERKELLVDLLTKV